MSWAEISIQTTHEATEAVAEIFHEVGATGVVIEDPELVEEYRRSGIWDYCGIPEAEDNSVVTVKAYLLINAELEDKMSRFKARVEELVNYGIDKGKGIITWQEIKEEDWENSWKEYFHATKVGERIVIKPSWEEYDAQEGEVVLELDPGMAFGTGTHHTTAMCLRLLEGLVKPGQEIFDIGTGSGVLSIAAAKLGATKILAVDYDELAVRIAEENVAANHTEDVITTRQGDLFKGIEGEADIVIANIIADIIIRLLPDAPSHLKKDGRMITSGIIQDRIDDVIASAEANGMVVEHIERSGDWAAMILRRGDGQ